MRALVTGATGFIGSHLVEELLRRGYDITCLVRNPSILTWIGGLDVTVARGDCEETDSLKDLPSADYVFHLAGLTKARKPEDFRRANVRGTENLLKALSARSSPPRFIYVSSLAAAGPSRNGIPLTETKEPMPVSFYGKSKLEGEQAVLRQMHAIPVTIVRPPAVYGPRDRDFLVLFSLLKKGFYPHMGKCYYSLLYVDDLVRGIVSAAESREAEGGVYFLSDGQVYSDREIAAEIASALDVKVVGVRIPRPIMALIVGISDTLSKKSSIMNKDKLRELRYAHWTCDPSKAARDFGFAPKVTIKEGMKWTADWYRTHQWL